MNDNEQKIDFIDGSSKLEPCLFSAVDFKNRFPFRGFFPNLIDTHFGFTQKEESMRWNRLNLNEVDMKKLQKIRYQFYKAFYLLLFQNINDHDNSQDFESLPATRKKNYTFRSVDNNAHLKIMEKHRIQSWKLTCKNKKNNQILINLA